MPHMTVAEARAGIASALADIGRLREEIDILSAENDYYTSVQRGTGAIRARVNRRADIYMKNKELGAARRSLETHRAAERDALRREEEEVNTAVDIAEAEFRRSLDSAIFIAHIDAARTIRWNATALGCGDKTDDLTHVERGEVPSTYGRRYKAIMASLTAKGFTEARLRTRGIERNDYVRQAIAYQELPRIDVRRIGEYLDAVKEERAAGAASSADLQAAWTAWGLGPIDAEPEETKEEREAREARKRIWEARYPSRR